MWIHYMWKLVDHLWFAVFKNLFFFIWITVHLQVTGSSVFICYVALQTLSHLSLVASSFNYFNTTVPQSVSCFYNFSYKCTFFLTALIIPPQSKAVNYPSTQCHICPWVINNPSSYLWSLQYLECVQYKLLLKQIYSF